MSSKGHFHLQFLISVECSSLQGS
uniref:Uncharacterized protein n=1 Tax=Rhizophora mucronata TaxID=61149 RepID=A0A2P2NXB5_RHIMU